VVTIIIGQRPIQSWRFPASRISVVVILHSLTVHIHMKNLAWWNCSQTVQKQCQGNRSTRTHMQRKREKKNKEREFFLKPRINFSS